MLKKLLNKISESIDTLASNVLRFIANKILKGKPLKFIGLYFNTVPDYLPPLGIYTNCKLTLPDLDWAITAMEMGNWVDCDIIVEEINYLSRENRPQTLHNSKIEYIEEIKYTGSYPKNWLRNKPYVIIVSYNHGNPERALFKTIVVIGCEKRLLFFWEHVNLEEYIKKCSITDQNERKFILENHPLMIAQARKAAKRIEQMRLDLNIGQGEHMKK